MDGENPCIITGLVRTVLQSQLFRPGRKYSCFSTIRFTRLLRSKSTCFHLGSSPPQRSKQELVRVVVQPSLTGRGSKKLMHHSGCDCRTIGLHANRAFRFSVLLTGRPFGSKSSNRP